MSYRSKPMKYQLSPLTEENLLKMNDNARSTSTYDAIERYYCSSGNEAPTHHQIQTQTRHRTPSPSLSHQPRSRRTSKDIVMESPRLLPFPYHNDCHFLPTAEHEQHQHQQKRKMGTGSFSDLSLRSYRTSITATSPTSTTTIPFSSYSARRTTSTHPRRSLSSTSTCHRDPVSEPSLSSSSSSSSTASSFYKMGSSFVARLLDLMKRKNRTQPPVDTITPSPSARMPKKNLVWFAEFAVNPPPPDGMVVTAA